MRLAPAVIVHGLDMARLAVSAAAEAGCDVTLLSAPGAAAYGGVGWWRALVRAACLDGVTAKAGQNGQVAKAAQSGQMARAAPNGRVVVDVLDCGEAPGRALEALRGGQRLLVLRAEPHVWADIAWRTAACGGVLLAEAPPALDLAVRGAQRHLSAWLSATDQGR